MGEDPRYHVRVGPKEVGGYVLLPGDRGRVAAIAAHLEDTRKTGENREYLTMTGTLAGERVSVMSSGMGSPCVAIGLEELRTAGVHTIIRVGTTGAVGPGPRLGDAIIAHGAVRTEGTSRAYIDLEYPAVADLAVTNALVQAAREASAPYHVGIVESSDAYYAGQWLREQAEPRAERMRRAGLLAIEMEASALFVVGRLHGVRTGCILTLREEWDAQGERRQAGSAFDNGLARNIRLAVDAVRILIEQGDDRAPTPRRRQAKPAARPRPRPRKLPTRARTRRV